jgi:hypothetical protein
LRPGHSLTAILILFLVLGSWHFSATPLRALDCNGNAVEDLLDLSRGTSPDCNANGVPDECDIAPFQFGQRERGTYAGAASAMLVAADLDGDGDTDLAAGNAELNGAGVTVVRNNGDSGLEVVGRFSAGTALQSVLAGDADGDGDIDLVTSNVTAVHILRNSGDASFADAERIETPSGTRFAMLADLSGDGLADLISSSTSLHQVAVQLQQGGGTFGAAVAHVVGEFPAWVVAADLDGDGDLDLASANKLSGSVSLLLNGGAGAFAAAVHVSIGTTFPPPQRRGGALLASGDLDLDGDVDLVVAASQSVTVLRNQGLSAFAAPEHFRSTPSSVALTDVDGDRDLDVTAGTEGTGSVFVIANDGGRLQASSSFSTEAPPRFVCPADLDGDGDPELCVATVQPDNVVVLWNSEDDALSVSTVTLGINDPPHGACMADLDGDGSLDVATSNGGRGNLSIILNNGTGTLAVRSRGVPGGYVNTLAAGDLDGDGDADLVAVDHNARNRVQVVLNDGQGRFAVVRNFPTGRLPFYVTTGDLDGDRDLEIITADEGGGGVSVLFNDGRGAFGMRRFLPTGQTPRGVVAVDLDGDGDIDLAAANSESDSLSVLRNNSDGSFQPAETYEVGGSASFVCAGDFDRDGDEDLAVAVTSGVIAAFYNRGDATFLGPVDFRLGQTTYTVLSTDINGDGFVDLVTANRKSPNSVSVLVNDGTGAFRPPFHFAVGDDPRYALAGDIDRDGDIDLVAANHDSLDITVLYNRSPAPALEDFLERICTAVDFHRLSVPSRAGGATLRSVRYLLPARDDPALLPALYQNTRRYALHQEFLQEVFPERFGGLSGAEYDGLVGRRATRDYFAGALFSLRSGQGTLWGFSVYTNFFADPAEILTLDEVRAIHTRLRSSFLLEPLAYYPDSPEARKAAAGWQDPGFPVFLDRSGGEVTYEAYTRAAGYGRVRILDQAAFERANSSGELSFQDILILERAPRDIEGVVGGVITAEPQGELSHLSVRTARRGTPNAFVLGAIEAFAPFAGGAGGGGGGGGGIVRLEVCDLDYAVRPATLEEAEAFWASNRPRIEEVPGRDEGFGGLDSLEDMDLSGALVSPVARYGGKATNLSRLQRILTGPFARYRAQGFAVPMRYYLEFLRSNRINSAVNAGRRVTYEEYIAELLVHPAFASDSQLRSLLLGQLRGHMEDNGLVPPGLVTSLAARIREVFGSTSQSVRFRSSSNIEDILEFNGAGLYRSTSACVDDETDSDTRGPSRCDPTQEDERTITRALRRVWASLWNFRAFEERAYFGLTQEASAMGVLVTEAFLGEQANGVAFTGIPGSPGDRRYLVTVQLGEESVVSPEPGVIPERDVLDVADGQVAGIERSRGSSLLPRGSQVLSDAQLQELGALLAHMDQNLPVELGSYSREDVLLDIEFKVDAAGDLAVKQVRPFLNVSTSLASPVFALEVPPGTIACGAFRAGRELREEYELKSTLRFASGRIPLPTGRESFEAELFEEVRFGPDQGRATPLGPGVFHVSSETACGGVSTYSFRFEQDFDLPSGARLRLVFSDLEFQAEGSRPLQEALVVDDALLTDIHRIAADPLRRPGRLRGSLGSGAQGSINYTSCGLGALPLFEVQAELEDGTTLHLEERFLDELSTVDTVPAALTRAEAAIAGKRRAVSDYWSLVYAAGRHNTNVRYWVVLEPPVEVAGLGAPVRILELIARDERLDIPPSARYLGADFQVLADVAVRSFQKQAVTAPPAVAFRRGDADADGSLNLTDAVFTLLYLFRGGEAPSCLKAADGDDSGALTLTDAVAVLLHLFAGRGPLPEPFAACGQDPSADGLGCGRFAACP